MYKCVLHLTRSPVPIGAAYSDSNSARRVFYQYHLGSAFIKLLRQCRCAMVNVISAAPLLARLSSNVMSRPTSTRHCHGQYHLGSAITRMTRGPGTYFPDQQSGLEVHHRSASGAQSVPLQSATQLRYKSTDVSLILNHQQNYRTLHRTS
jgi:hypothetical protein